eukprot:TRINITY_DN3108_c0_g5_i1.p1 TRINITY_DN3108_c0_g5~~TRINITY_DN3108_c0_g5_i1.p1  ORF type:complete len:318 (-),score=57.17 TRINITY_DN3108_c0_g5_i1:124-1077(-)
MGVSGLETFYTEYAGLHDEISTTRRDAYANPEGTDFDLGIEGAFSQFTILVGSFYCEITKDVFMGNPGKRLLQKGFKILFEDKPSNFARRLDECDIALFISNSAGVVPVYTLPVYGKGKGKGKKPATVPIIPFFGGGGFGSGEAFTEQEIDDIEKFHEKGGALFIWGDNDPYFQSANQVLDRMFNIKLAGNTPGGGTLTVGDGKTTGQFARHLITSGVVNLFEGITISYPENPHNLGPFEILATSTNGNTSLMYAEQGRGKLPDHVGRIIVDTGFTKLYCNWDTAGTARYVLNACVWLLGLDHKLKIGAPLSVVGKS